ncbi:PREDICTED: histone H2A-like [Nicotiana attenuata]|uniref:histone H2A-like n=1 Tax=Nicotiana attenuata TaxID=49451 RepID=UPI0009050326|nr:PREDICTED: histone H2A-like [Nicotiana attenuata]
MQSVTQAGIFPVAPVVAQDGGGAQALATRTPEQMAPQFQTLAAQPLGVVQSGVVAQTGSRAAKKVTSHSSKAGPQFPVGRIARFLKADKYAEHVGAGAPVYLAAVLEYLAAEVNFVFGLFSSVIFA